MESTPVNSSESHSGLTPGINNPDSGLYPLVNIINFILDIIITNTLHYNILTTTEDIYNGMKSMIKRSAPDQENSIDIETIDKLCLLLSSGNGILINIRKNKINYYKLKIKDRV